MQWEHLFETHILNRGLDYYNRGLVEDFKENNNLIKATVIGAEDYEVTIGIEDSMVHHMECNCMYARKGNNCKHMAALLYYFEENKYENTLNETIENTDDYIKKVVEEADLNILREFLVEIFKSDKKIFYKFLTLHNLDVGNIDLELYKEEINDIFEDYEDNDGYINYYNAYDFISDLEQFIDDTVMVLLKGHKYNEVFDLIRHIFIYTGDQSMDDSDGGTIFLFNKCIKILREVISVGDKMLNRIILDWVLKEVEKPSNDYIEHYLEDFLFDVFRGDEFIEVKKRLIERKIAYFKTKDIEEFSEYNSEKWIMRNIALMEEEKLPVKEIMQYCEENIIFHNVREYYVLKCIEEEDYLKAIEILKDGKKADREYKRYIKDYSLQLKDLYKLTDNIEAYEKELNLLVLEYCPGDVEIFKEIKQLYAKDEWKEKREEVFSKLPNYYLGNLFKEERLYDRLLIHVQASEGIGSLLRYEDVLKEIYPKELLDKYEYELEEFAAFNVNRKSYQELVSNLRRMFTYSKGKERVEDIVNRWKKKYKNRPAMIEELNKL
ncbi:SWIM zinc finger family protein [Miniphocaeibacter halophilus]|uniref:SWIM zinc finger family protein n=1 Tax=Miniphocaeibacter halophilus TaxID=2931922 RepID=A0AC61MZN6_9FIRM|nr:SWIM zinc finger family protein [Miniphocaeibacter halophilus]QQK08418.1 SWIM zinc finger family protein [Miniphocaeibacter halophilus]